ncbi:MAG TPA: sigma-70 family RNA polymerase sigma factor [Anaerolineaceae bacterium]|nr:sigma-70 family RNA polymerase sigma factor [Anaerolineaceae bacterium]
MTTDPDWIRQAQQGDAEAWARIVQEYQQPVFRLAYLLLGDADDAEDVAQETFIRAYRALGRFDPERPIRPWLLRIATNAAYNWQRSFGRYLAAVERHLRGEPAPPPTDQQVEQRQEAAALWQALRNLNPMDRQVILLRYFLESSESEMAEVLRVPAGTVKSRLHRALGRLRQALPEQPPEGLQEGIDG